MRLDKCIALLVGTLILWPTFSSAQDPGQVKFSGSSRFYGQYADRQGTGQALSAEFWQWEISPTLTVRGMPISAHIFVSSEQSAIRQDIDRFSLSIEPGRFLGRLPFLAAFSKISIGASNPNYTPLTLNGSRVTGVDLELTPGKFYLAFTAGQTRKAIQGPSIFQSSYSRNLVSGRLGIGSRNGDHFLLTAMHARDDSGSLAADSALANLNPRENFLGGASAALHLFQKKLRLEGEFNLSYLTNDTRSARISSSEIPAFLDDLLNPRISSQLDYAYAVKSVLNLRTTRVSGSVKYIGPGYVSLGVPFLVNDKLSYRVAIEQQFAGRQVNVSTYVRRSEDNLIPWKQTRTRSTAFGFAARLNFRRLPFLQLNFAPYYQKNDGLSIDNRTSLVTAVSGYNAAIGSVNLASNLLISIQDSKTESSGNDFNSRTISFNEAVSFRFPLQLSGALSVLNSEFSGTGFRVLSYDFNGAYTLMRVWQNTAGLRIDDQENSNRKIGFYFYSRFPAGPFGHVNLQLEQNMLRNERFTQAEYDELLVRFTLTRNW